MALRLAALPVGDLAPRVVRGLRPQQGSARFHGAARGQRGADWHAVAATAAAALFAQPVWDGVGSILIGILWGITSIGLARESKSLLIGEPAHSDLSRSILDIARRSSGVLRANGLLTVQLSPAEVVAALSVEFADDKRADDIEQCVISIETEIRRQHPSVAVHQAANECAVSRRSRQALGYGRLKHLGQEPSAPR